MTGSETEFFGSGNGSSSTDLVGAAVGLIVGLKAAGFGLGASSGSFDAGSDSTGLAGFMVGRKAAGFGFGVSSGTWAWAWSCAGSGFGSAAWGGFMVGRKAGLGFAGSTGTGVSAAGSAVLATGGFIVGRKPAGLATGAGASTFSTGLGAAGTSSPGPSAMGATGFFVGLNAGRFAASRPPWAICCISSGVASVNGCSMEEPSELAGSAGGTGALGLAVGRNTGRLGATVAASSTGALAAN